MQGYEPPRKYFQVCLFMNLSTLCMALMVLTSNVNGAHNPEKWPEIWLNIPQSDLIYFQETYLLESQEFAFKLHKQSYDFFFSHGTSASAGVCIAIYHNLGVIIHKVGFILGYLIALDLVLLDGFSFWVIGIYAPPDSSKRLTFFVQMSDFLTPITLLLGDFNSVIDSCDRLSNNLDTTSVSLQSILMKWDLKEPPSSHLLSFTYHHPSLSSRKSYLDQYYTNFQSTWRGYCVFAPFSDHYCVGLLLSKPVDVGHQMWWFLGDLLSNNSFCSQTQLILECFYSSESVTS